MAWGRVETVLPYQLLCHPQQIAVQPFSADMVQISEFTIEATLSCGHDDFFTSWCQAWLVEPWMKERAPLAKCHSHSILSVLGQGEGEV